MIISIHVCEKLASKFLDFLLQGAELPEQILKTLEDVNEKQNESENEISDFSDEGSDEGEGKL